MFEFNWASNCELQMVNSLSELLWHELNWQGEDIWCIRCVFTGFLLKLPATIFSSREAPRKIPCLHNPDYLAAVNNNTCEIVRTVSKKTPKHQFWHLCLCSLCISSHFLRCNCTGGKKSADSYSEMGKWFLHSLARLAGHMETHAKHPEGSLGVKTVREAVPAKWDEKDIKNI